VYADRVSVRCQPQHAFSVSIYCALECVVGLGDFPVPLGRVNPDGRTVAQTKKRSVTHRVYRGLATNRSRAAAEYIVRADV